MLKTLQNRMKRAALSEESMSSVPALTGGLLAMMPTTMPWMRAKPTMMLLAHACMHFQEIAVVHEAGDDLGDVERILGVLRAPVCSSPGPALRSTCGVG